MPPAADYYDATMGTGLVLTHVLVAALSAGSGGQPGAAGQPGATGQAGATGQPGAAGQRAAQERPPDFRVQIEAVADFAIRAQAYSDLRRKLERGLPALHVTEDAAALLDRERALRDRIRAARAHEKQGSIFTPEVSGVFKEKLQIHRNPATCAALLDENPGAIDVGVNDKYPEHQPMSTMPANVLAELPRLPEDMEYRFLGRDLILVDTRARLVVDRMPLATLCSNDVK